MVISLRELIALIASLCRCKRPPAVQAEGARGMLGHAFDINFDLTSSDVCRQAQ